MLRALLVACVLTVPTLAGAAPLTIEIQLWNGTFGFSSEQLYSSADDTPVSLNDGGSYSGLDDWYGRVFEMFGGPLYDVTAVSALTTRYFFGPMVVSLEGMFTGRLPSLTFDIWETEEDLDIGSQVYGLFSIDKARLSRAFARELGVSRVVDATIWLSLEDFDGGYAGQPERPGGSHNQSWIYINAVPVPEPATAVLVAFGLLACCRRARL